MASSCGQICHQCQWRHQVAKFLTYASGTTLAKFATEASCVTGGETDVGIRSITQVMDIIGPGPDVPLAMLFNSLESAFWLKSGVGDSCFRQFQLLQILIWQKIQIITNSTSTSLLMTLRLPEIPTISGSSLLHLPTFHLLGFCWDDHSRPHIRWDGSQQSPSQTPTIHPSRFFGHNSISIPKWNCLDHFLDMT